MSEIFSTISKIAPNHDDTWASKLFLTFDIDWAHDNVLMDTVGLVTESGIPSTWFVTHPTPILNEIRKCKNQELGIHPNFNALLDGSGDSECNPRTILRDLLVIVPEAKSIRSHSMTQSTRLLDEFKAIGLSHDANHFIPQHANIKLKPWFLWNQLCKVPYVWEDDVHLMYESIGISQKDPVELAGEMSGIKVFDFHPIHVFLNSESLDRYECTRSLHNNPKELIKYRYEGYGTRNRLIDLINLAKES